MESFDAIADSSSDSSAAITLQGIKVELASLSSGESSNRSSFVDNNLNVVAMTKPANSFSLKVFDVCAYVVMKSPGLSLAKLQLLIYYSFVWTLVWDEIKLFDDNILAGPNGPIIPILYDYFKGQLLINNCPLGNHERIPSNVKETVDIVIREYGAFSTADLINGVKQETPWRTSFIDGERAVIPTEGMLEYYRSLV